MATTITGGMAFAGGPFNNFVLQATVAMIERLRRQPGERSGDGGQRTADQTRSHRGDESGSPLLAG